MSLKQSALVALAVSLAGISAWELYWRSQGYWPTLNDDKELWAVHRARVEEATEKDFVILGSSRAYFDLQAGAFESATGRKPIQLSATGSSPLPSFHDLVHHSDFRGTVILGVTPAIFFSTTFPQAPPWERIQNKVDYFHERTHAQRLNYPLSSFLQQNLVFMSGDEEEWIDDIDLKALLQRIRLGNRTGAPQMPPFYFFGDVSPGRNMRMTPQTVTDTALANSVARVWAFFGKGAPPPDKDATMAFFLSDLETFRARGGKLILVRCPSSGGLREAEKQITPRADFWDDLVARAQVPAYHFEDYESLKGLTCPEESHLSGPDADYFTQTLVGLMQADGAIPNR